MLFSSRLITKVLFYLKVHNFPGKGRGIVATQLFRRGEFVVEYSGDLIDMTEAREREKLYAADQNTGCYMYYFQHKNQSYWYVDLLLIVRCCV
jgi:histone-lysine N-methyltransferase SETD8